MDADGFPFVSLELIKASTFGSDEVRNALVITNSAGYCDYQIVYQLPDSLEEIRQEYPLPWSFLKCFGTDELVGLAYDWVDYFSLIGFEHLYSKEQIRHFESMVASYCAVSHEKIFQSYRVGGSFSDSLDTSKYGQWVSTKDRYPPPLYETTCRIKWDSSGKIETHVLRAVDEGDCSWRTFFGGSEISYFCTVTEWFERATDK